MCEEHFLKTHKRDDTGRYVLRLPFSEKPNVPGSLSTATSRLLQTERRLMKNAQLRAAYNQFMMELVNLNHMEIVPEEDRSKPRGV